jgi:Tfp pilus assembly protein PilF
MLVQLRVHILTGERASSRARVELRGHTLPAIVKYADRRGDADFHGLSPGIYTLTVSHSDKELYRDEIVLGSNEAFRTEVIPVRVPDDRARPEVISVLNLRVPAKARAYFISGLDAVHAARWQKAIDAFKKALALHSDYPKAHNALGVVLAITKNNEGAESAFRNAIRLEKDYAEAHFNLGKLFLETNRPAEARPELERDLELDPSHSPAIELLVESMIRTGDEDDASSFMISLHQRQIQHSPVLHLEIGMALERHSRFELAAEQYSEAFSETSSESEKSEAIRDLLRLGIVPPQLEPNRPKPR